MIGRAASVVVVLVAGCGSPSPETNPVIAQIAGQTIRYYDIRCDSRYHRPPDDDRCRTFEQRRLDEIIEARLYREAARIHGVTVTDAEVLASLPVHAIPSDHALRAADRQWKAIAQAYLDIERGADPGHVYRSRLEPLGVTRLQFESVRKQWSAGDADRALTHDFVGDGKRQLLEQYRRPLLRRRLQESAERRRRGSRLTPEAAWRALWEETIARSGAAVVDTRYRLPDIERL